MFRAIITMMDVPSALTLLAPRIQRLSRGGALLIFSCCLIALGPLGYLWWRFDLSSTWNWFSWLIADGTPGQIEVQGAVRQTGADDQTAGLIMLLFGVGFTLLPSVVQIGLARFVSIPALGLLVKVSLGLDLATDWGPIWELAASNPWYQQQFVWWPLVGLARLAATALGAILASVIVQSATLLVAAAMLYLTAVIVVGPTPTRGLTAQTMEG